MHQPNLNYQQDLLEEPQQLEHLAELAKLLDNIWFKHLVALMLTMRDNSRAAVCEFPLNNIQHVLTALQTRGEAVSYGLCANQAYEIYNNLVQQLKDKENERDSGN
jgi:hypothetical protein